ncbi:MAG: cupredoxin domain-containing protein [Chloroflexi bacterium]|nr:cupredoxin domain-containing protein [Chloroflexota bacterium]
MRARRVGASYRFNPNKITVKVGTRITWQNPTDAPHTVTSRTRGWTFNKVFGVSKAVSFVFKKAGTFKYYCRFHPGMVGTIVVKK